MLLCMSECTSTTDLFLEPTHFKMAATGNAHWPTEKNGYDSASFIAIEPVSDVGGDSIEQLE